MGSVMTKDARIYPYVGAVLESQVKQQNALPVCSSLITKGTLKLYGQ